MCGVNGSASAVEPTKARAPQADTHARTQEPITIG